MEKNSTTQRPSIDASTKASGNVHEAELVGDGQSSPMLTNEGLSHELYENEKTFIVRENTFVINSASTSAHNPKRKDG